MNENKVGICRANDVLRAPYAMCTRDDANQMVRDGRAHWNAGMHSVELTAIGEQAFARWAKLHGWSCSPSVQMIHLALMGVKTAQAALAGWNPTMRAA